MILASLFVAAACGGEAPEAPEAEITQWALPDRLREISGLALTSDERLLAVTDEEAIVYEIDYTNGRLLKAFALGEPTVRGDFEGIAVLDGTVWLMTSEGVLFSAPEGADGERVLYERFATNLEDECEFEGLTASAAGDALLLICKDPKAKKDLSIFEWSPATWEMQRHELPEKAMEAAVGSKKINPSGIAVDPATGDFIVIAAIQHAVLRLDGAGELIGAIMRLAPERHPQAEGVSVTRDGRLLIADEAANGQARLTVYPLNDRDNAS